MTDTLPKDAPDLSSADFTLTVSLLSNERGTLLIEDADTIRRRYADMLDNVPVRWPDDEARQSREQKGIEAARDKEIELLGQVVEQNKAAIKNFSFVFGSPSVEIIEDCERAAALPIGVEAPDFLTALNLRPAYKRALAAKTFLRSDFPGMESAWGKLPASIGEYLTEKVSQRTRFSNNMRDFLLF